MNGSMLRLVRAYSLVLVVLVVFWVKGYFEQVRVFPDHPTVQFGPPQYIVPSESFGNGLQD